MDDAADRGAGAAAAGGGAAGAAAGSSGVGESACGLRGGLDPSKLVSRLGAEEEASAASPGGRSCWSRSREDEPLRMPRRLRMRSRNTTSFSGSASLSARTCSSASCAASACRPSTRPCPARTDRDDGVAWAAAGDARSLSDPELSVRNMASGFGRTAGARRRPGKGCLPRVRGRPVAGSDAAASKRRSRRRRSGPLGQWHGRWVPRRWPRHAARGCPRTPRARRAPGRAGRGLGLGGSPGAGRELGARLGARAAPGRRQPPGRAAAPGARAREPSDDVARFSSLVSRP